MCLIAHRVKPGTHIPDKVIDHNRTANPDGFGLMWRDTGGKLHGKKWGPEDFAPFRAALKKLDKTNVEYAAHWRYATHGPACEPLSHPFAYEDPEAGETLVMHNGIIDGLSIPKGESDTSAFVSTVLANMPGRWYEQDALLALVQMAVGWSRLLIMTEAETIRLNHWVVDGGVHYSTTPIPKAWGNYVKGAGVSGKLAPVSTWGKYDDEDKDSDDDMKLLPSRAEAASEESRWWDMGHEIIPMTSEVASWDQGDKVGSCWCEPCGVKGDWYRINGELYIDMKHKVTE